MFFQRAPVVGTVIVVVLTLMIALFASTLPKDSDPELPDAWKWIKIYLLLSVISLCWTSGDKTSAAGYLLITLAETYTVWRLLWCKDRTGILHDSMRGLAYGALFIGLLALTAIGQAEGSRIGNDDFLHPNMVGYSISLGLFASVWLWRATFYKRWAAVSTICFAMLLRSFSKTSIVASCFALAIYFIFFLKVRFRTKVAIALSASIVVLVLLPLLLTYFDEFVDDPNTGEQNVLTVSGRTFLWAILVSEYQKKPILGWGFYSVKAFTPDEWDVNALQAHNEILQQLFTLGLVGLGVSSVVYFKTARHFLRSRNWFAIMVLLFFVVRGVAEADFYGLGMPVPMILLLLPPESDPMHKAHSADLATS